jgi:hypothetical protein
MSTFPVFPEVIENFAIFSNIDTMFLYHPLNEIVTVVIVDANTGAVKAITGYRMLIILKTPGAIRVVQSVSVLYFFFEVQVSLLLISFNSQHVKSITLNLQ